MASSNVSAHKRANYITFVFVTLGNATNRSYQIVQGNFYAQTYSRRVIHGACRWFYLQSCQLFMSVAVNQPGIDYHVVLAQNALQQCLDMAELQAELICILVKQTSRHTSQKLGAGVQVNKKLGNSKTRVSLAAKLFIFCVCAFQLVPFFLDAKLIF